MQNQNGCSNVRAQVRSHRILTVFTALVSSLSLHQAALYAKDAAPNADASPRIVILGDSLTAGHGLDPSEAYPTLLQKKIDDAGWHFTVVNAGVSGDTTADGLSRINWLLRQKIDVFILALGGNDGLRGVSVTATRKNLQAIIDRVTKRYPNAVVIIAGMQMPPNLGKDYTTAFAKIFPDIAKANHAALIPFLLEGVGGDPKLNQADRIHPTAEGQKILAQNVWKILRPVLEKMNAGGG